MDLCCATCTITIAAEHDVFFCSQECTKQVHLSIKPESSIGVESTKLIIQTHGKKGSIFCKSCETKLGVKLPFGPNGAAFCAFGRDKVKLGSCGPNASKGETWAKIYTRSEFSSIDTRNMDTFFGEPLEVKRVIVDNEEFRDGDIVINFPANIPDYWNSFELDVLENKKLYPYQLEAVVETLNKDTVAILPTGFGKTLIASLFMLKMKELNPSTMCLMLVDKIPLAYQQGNAVRSDTDMMVCILCSESKTTSMIAQLNDGKYDCLVSTAGCFLECLRRKSLSMDMFNCIVIDECHHSNGKQKHVYNEVLDLWRARFCRQRLLGLTASPFFSNNVATGEKKLAQFRRVFGFAGIYFPSINLQNNNQEVFWKICENDENLAKFEEEIKAIMFEDLHTFRTQVGEEAPEDFLNPRYIPAVRGMLRKMRYRKNSTKKIRESICRFSCCFDIVIFARMFGIKIALDELAIEYPQIASNLEYLSTKPFGNRLEELLRQIKDAADENSKILVFASQKNVVKKLASVLQKEVADRKPKMLVGHGGSDGMQWEGEQEEVIKKFKGEECKLVVCTSVLEEGIDVASCDLVIRFNGVHTLIQFVQSKGRARKKGSKFVVLMGVDESNQMKSIEYQKELLHLLLKRDSHYQACPSSETLRIVEFLKTKSKSFETKDELVTTTITHIKHSFCMDILISYPVLEADAQISDSFLSESIYYEVTSTQMFKPVRILIQNIDCASPDRVFGATKKAVLYVKAECVPNETINDRFRRFCAVFSYTLPGIDQCNLFVTPTRVGRSISSNPLTIVSSNAVSEEGDTIVSSLSDEMRNPGFLHFGNFEDHGLFSKADLDSDDKGHEYIESRDSLCLDSVTFDQKNIRMRYESGGVDCGIIINLSIISPILLKTQISNDFYIFLHLSSIPVVYSLEDDMISYRKRTSRSYGFQDSTLCKFATNNFIYFKFSKVQCNEFERVIQLKGNGRRFKTCNAGIKIRHSQAASPPLTVPPLNSSYSFDCLWSLNVLRSQRNMYITETVYKHLSEWAFNAPREDSLNQRSVSFVLNYLASLAKSAWCDSNIMKEHEFFSQLSNNEIQIIEPKTLETSVLLKQLFVTPSRLIYRSPVFVQKNRLLRLWESDNDFDLIIVCFVDEQLDKVVDASVFDHVAKCIEHGLTLCENRHYVYLCSSASQLRSHSAYFIYPEDKANWVREQFMPQKDNTKLSVPKYVSRFGLFCTADREVLHLKRSQYKTIPDIETVRSKENVTDGAGLMSRAFADIVKAKLDLECIPSAIQVRFAGYKGILVIHDDANDLGSFDILFRPSMKKCVSPHSVLTVTSYSKYNGMTLNRDVLTLLDALKVPGPFLCNLLMEKQELFLDKLVGRFHDSAVAQDALRQKIETKLVDTIYKASPSTLQDDFWIDVLKVTYMNDIVDLLDKTSIPLENAALLIGVPDVYGCLADDQVFVKIQKPFEEAQVITGSVIVYRNPCLHPGDVRKLQAVSVSRLSHLINVVVFPAKIATCSIPSQCSGGDLDGDKFSIIWDEDFVKTMNESFAPLDYGSLAPQTASCPALLKDECNRSGPDICSIAKYYKDVVSNDALGRIAHLHLALCDQLTDGACDPLAIELSKSQSVAVDFPKTGILPEVPSQAIEHVRKRGTPHFMRKTPDDGEKTYVSEKVIGKLFERCDAVAFVPKYKDLSLYKTANLCDSMFLVKGYEDTLEMASHLYVQYKKEVNFLLATLGLVSDAELMAGRPVQWDPVLTGDRERVLKLIAELKISLGDKYRSIVYSSVLSDENLSKFVSACYFISYTDNSSDSCLSFVWIMAHDVMCALRSTNKVSGVTSNYQSIFGLSTMDALSKSKNEITEVLREKESVLSRISKSLEPENVSDCHLYGSVPLFLFGNFSDVDVFLDCESVKMSVYSSLSSTDWQIQILSNKILPYIAHICCEAPRLVANTAIPIIRASVVNKDDNPVSVDISLSKTGFWKTRYIQTLYVEHPGLFPAMWAVVKWARFSEIVKNQVEVGQADLNCLMPTSDFYILALYLMFSFEVTRANKILQEPLKFDDLIASIGKVKCDDSQEQLIHQFLERFFHCGSMLNGSFDLKLTWPVKTEPVTLISACVVQIVMLKCLSALHCLGFTGNIEALFYHSLSMQEASTSFRKVVPKSLACKISDCYDFHASVLSVNTNAVVHFSTGPPLILTATGTSLDLETVQSNFVRLCQSHCALSIGTITARSSRYFLDGASLIIVNSVISRSASCIFLPSFGPYNQIHYTTERSCVALKSKLNKVDEESWIEQTLETLQDRLRVQVGKIKIGDRKALKELHFSAIFGKFYLLDVSNRLPATNKTRSLDELEHLIDKNRLKKRTAFERPDFKLHERMAIAKQSQNQFQLTTLGQSKVNYEHREEMVKIRKRNDKKSLGSSFCPGILKLNESSPESIIRCQRVYQTALERCEYSRNCIRDDEEGYLKISMVPSLSYNATIATDKNLQVISTNEKRFTWFHVSILTGLEDEKPSNNEKIFIEPDLRICLQSEKDLDGEEDFLRFLYPPHGTDRISPVGYNEKSGEVSVEKHIVDAGYQKRIIFVRVKHSCQKYEKVVRYSPNKITKITASLKTGVEFSGNNLKEKKSFCELYLDFDMDQLKGILMERYPTNDELNQLSKTVFAESLKVVNNIKKLVNSS